MYKRNVRICCRNEQTLSRKTHRFINYSFKRIMRAQMITRVHTYSRSIIFELLQFPLTICSREIYDVHK